MFMNANGTVHAGTIWVCVRHFVIRKKLVKEQSIFSKSITKTNSMSDFRNFRYYRSPRFSTDPPGTRLGQFESIEKSSLRRPNVHTSDLLSPSWKLGVFESLRLSEFTQQNTPDTREPHEKTTSGLLLLQIILSGIDCGSLALPEFVKLKRQRVHIVVLT